MLESTLINTQSEEYKHTLSFLSDGTPKQKFSTILSLKITRQVQKQVKKLVEVNVDIPTLSKAISSNSEVSNRIFDGSPIRVIFSWELDKNALSYNAGNFKLVTYSTK